DEDTSAFLLDFGSVWVVEFSRSGNACYIYNSNAFSGLIPDIWAPLVFRHSRLKRKDHCRARLVHKPGWQSAMRGLLSREGVFPARGPGMLRMPLAGSLHASRSMPLPTARRPAFS